ncbi:MAG: TIGR03905 family TSCPD domain-containing protein [Rikenellaceae bacterium]
MSTFEYTPSGVCSRQIEIEMEGDTIKSVKFYGGCDGNLQGISRLVAGQKCEAVASMLQGIDCRGKGTSCPDQLAKALLSINEK